MLKVQQYVRKPFPVEVVQVTKGNRHDVAKWCGGDIIWKNAKTVFIKVNVSRPMTERQTQAFTGDYIIKTGNTFKVYTEEAFAKNFDPAPEEPVVIHEDPNYGEHLSTMSPANRDN